MAKSNTLSVVRSSLEIGDSNSGRSLAPNAYERSSHEHLGEKCRRTFRGEVTFGIFGRGTLRLLGEKCPPTFRGEVPSEKSPRTFR